MRWCADNRIFYVFGLASNPRLVKRIAKEQKKTHRLNHRYGQAQRVYKEISHRTLENWSRPRRLIGKPE